MGAAVLGRSNDTVWSTFLGEEMRPSSRKLPSSNRKTDRSAVLSCQRVGHRVLESYPLSSPCKTRDNDQVHLPLMECLVERLVDASI